MADEELALVLETDVDPVVVIQPFRVVATIAARNAIPAAEREEGIFVSVQADDKIYHLVDGILNADWQEYAPPAAGSEELILAGQTTTGLTSGDVCYLSAAATWTKAKSDGTGIEASARGVSSGVAGSMTLPGSFVPDAQFTTAGGAPANGARIFLAAGADDAGTGAGKLTATPPTSGYDAPMGVVVSAANYIALKTCAIVFAPEPFTIL